LTALRTDAFDAVVLPTVPLLARPIADLQANDDESKRCNLLYLRNTSIANTLDAPAISIPCQAAGTAPVGLMLLGHHGRDRQLLSVAQSLEGIIRLD
jgi:Asp-tRNA(Asn)/Glu-tRNA(Gln) amidotransferase A subunit family amidase